MKELKLIEKKHPLTQLLAKEVQKMCVNNEKKAGWSLIFSSFSGNKININWSFTVVFTAIREIVKVNWNWNFKQREKSELNINNKCATSTISMAKTIALMYAAMKMCNLLSWYVIIFLEYFSRLSVLRGYCSAFELTARTLLTAEWHRVRLSVQR